MRFVSLFAGIGGFDLGLERAGMTCVGQCEIDPHARAVLERHWPDVPKHDDVTTLTVDAFGPADVITFGSPCQDLSVAGKRAGLDGERSGLFLEAVRYIRDMLEETNGRSPRFAVWENVPGAYSSNGGRDFAAVLQALVGGDVRCPANGWANAGVAFGPLGALEWRTLDSQHFGVAQRRRRVFVVYRPGGERAGEVLLEPGGVPGHPPKGRAPGERVAPTLEGRAGRSGATNFHTSGGLVETVAPTVTASWGHHGHSSPRGDGTDPIVPVAIAPTDTHPTLNAAHGGKDAGPAGLVPVAFALRGREDGAMPEVSGDKASALRGAAGGSSRDMVAYAATDYSTGSFAETEHAGPLTATEDRSRAGIITNPITYAVRRLTPRECERLQGFPDGWTELGHYYEGFDRERLWNAKTRTRPKGEEAEAIVRKIADTHRYRMLGNAVSVPVAAWIAKRVAQAFTSPANPLDPEERFSEGHR